MSENISRRKAREYLLGLLFECEFRPDEDYIAVFASSAEEREIPADPYIKNAFYTIFEKKDEIDGAIAKRAKGWRVDRLSKLSRSILRLGTYEILFEEDIPFSVTINEMVDLSKEYDDPKAKGFINGVLNGIKDDAAEAGIVKKEHRK
jgi:N utilization substance protein B